MLKALQMGVVSIGCSRCADQAVHNSMPCLDVLCIACTGARKTIAASLLIS